MGPAAAVAPSLELQIADAATGLPIAGAIVHYLDPTQAQREELDRSGDDLGALEDLLLARGSEHRSDERGIVRLPAVGPKGIAVARHGDLWGAWWFSRRDPLPYRLELRPDAVVHVIASTEGGEPVAELDVALYQQRLGWPRAFPDVLVHTGPDGRAAFRHASWRFQHAEPADWTIRAEALVDPRPSVPIDPAALPPETVELVLPATGAVEVEVREANGVPRASPTQVWLRDASEPLAEGFGGSKSQGVERVVRTTARGGKAVFAAVALGLELEAGAPFELGSGSEILARGSGPARAGERVTLRLDFGMTHPILTGRVVDADGRALASEPVQLRLRSTYEGGGGSGDGAREVLDERGRFRIDLPAGRKSLARRDVTLRSRRDERLSLRIDVPLDLGPGEHDLGDLRLLETPLLASGRVVGPTGEPFERASIEIETAKPMGSPEQLVWMRTFDVEAIRMPGGAFEVRSWDPVSLLRLRATAESLSPSPQVEVAAGSAPVDLRMGLVSGIEGRVILREGMLPAQLDVRALWTSDPKLGKETFQPAETQGELDAEARYRFGGLRPGTYQIDLHSRLDFGWEPLCSLEGVVVPLGAIVSAPDIDLNVLLHEHVVEVVDPEGQPIASGTGTYELADSGRNCDLTIANGVARILTRHAELDAWFGAPGYSCENVPKLSGRARVVLRPALPVRLRLASNAVLPPPPHGLFAYLYNSLGADNWVLGEIGGSAWGSFDERGEVVLRAPGARQYWVRFAVGAPPLNEGHGVGPGSAFLAHERRPPLEVRDEPGEQVFEIEVDAAAVQAALQKLADD